MAGRDGDCPVADSSSGSSIEDNPGAARLSQEQWRFPRGYNNSVRHLCVQERVSKIIAETSRFRIEFLHRELELTQTFLELARTEFDFDVRGAFKAMHLAHEGLNTIRKYVDRVTAPDRKPIAEKLVSLELQAATLRSAFGPARGVGKAVGERSTVRSLENYAAFPFEVGRATTWNHSSLTARIAAKY